MSATVPAVPARLKLLLLLPFAPSAQAAHGGGRVLTQLVTALATRHRVGLLYLRAAHEPPLEPALAAQCELVEEVIRPGLGPTASARWWRRAHMAWGWVRGRPMLVTDWFVPRYGERLSAVAAAWQPDVVQCEFHLMAQYLSVVATRPPGQVLTIHEPGIQAATDVWRSCRGGSRWIAGLDLVAWSRFERRIVAQVDAIVVFTQRDQAAITPIAPRTPIFHIPFGVPVPARPLSALGEPPARLLFVGSFIHPPNIAAALRLVTAILPRVQVICPEARVEIVGDQPPPALRALTTDQVIVTGFVPTVLPYLERAAIVVVPLTLGGGMRVKVLEALASGKAIIASPRALAGLAVTHGEHVLVAETDDEFAAAIVDLLRHPDRRVRLGAAAHQWAQVNLGWETVVTGYETVYQAISKD